MVQLWMEITKRSKKYGVWEIGWALILQQVFTIQYELKDIKNFQLIWEIMEAFLVLSRLRIHREFALKNWV